MNEINARLLQALIAVGYFTLAIAVCAGLMKFFGKYLVKTATAFLIAFPVVGIIGGTIEWIITGVSEASKSITFNIADKCFGIAIILYALAFVAHILFSDEERQSSDLLNWFREKAIRPLQGIK